MVWQILRLYWKWLGMAGALMCLAGCVEHVDGQLDVTTRAPDAMGFAINDVCLPYVRHGGDIAALVGRSGIPVRVNDLPAYRLRGAGHIHVGDGGPKGRGCFVFTTFGPTVGQRDYVLKTLLEDGYRPDALAGPNAYLYATGQWYDMIEKYCFRVDGKVMLLDMRTATKGPPSTFFRYRPMVAHVYWDEKGEAAGKGLCQSEAVLHPARKLADLIKEHTEGSP